MASVKQKTGAGLAAAVIIALPLVMQWEGVWLTARTDTIGTGHPVTYCYGQTSEFGQVKIGEKFTLDQCRELLEQSLPVYAEHIAPCIHVPIPDMVRAALISASYNAGAAAVCHSPMVADLNRGDGEAACEAFKTWYIRADGRVVQGLINRRADESAMCFKGLNEPKPQLPKPWWQIFLGDNDAGN